MKFGFLMDRKEFECYGFSIKKMPNFDETIKSFYESALVSNGWIYGSSSLIRQSIEEKKLFFGGEPVATSRPFPVVCTHTIESDIEDQYHLKFLILGYGFLQGVLLLPEGHQYLRRTPYKTGMLTGLILCRNDYVNGMNAINNFYINSSAEQRRTMFAVIHWFLMGQSYEYEWERFDQQYKVLDGLYKLNSEKMKAGSHSKRPIFLADMYGVELPEWAFLDENDKSSKLSKLRNNLAHEAVYADEPIGYAVAGENYSLEFAAFNAKLIIASLGINCPYLKANPENRSQWGWDIVKP